MIKINCYNWSLNWYKQNIILFISKNVRLNRRKLLIVIGLISLNYFQLSQINLGKAILLNNLIILTIVIGCMNREIIINL